MLALNEAIQGVLKLDNAEKIMLSMPAILNFG